MPILARGARALLHVLPPFRDLGSGNFDPSACYGCCLYGVCATLGANVLLGGNCHYKSILSPALYRGGRCKLDLRGICRRQRHLNPVFCFPLLGPNYCCSLCRAHLLFLHQSGSSNPLGLRARADKVPFHPYFTIKDLRGFLLFTAVILFVVTAHPWALGDPENFIPANPLVTPVHIQPEWYFLFAYAILRSIPNKLGGVLALAGAVAILFIMPAFPANKFLSLGFYPVSKTCLWAFFCVAALLT